MLTLLVKLHAAPREFHEPEPRMASRKLTRTVENQIKTVPLRFRVKRIL